MFLAALKHTVKQMKRKSLDVICTCPFTVKITTRNCSHISACLINLYYIGFFLFHHYCYKLYVKGITSSWKDVILLKKLNVNFSQYFRQTVSFLYNYVLFSHKLTRFARSYYRYKSYQSIYFKAY